MNADKNRGAKKEEEAMRYVPSFNDFNSNVSSPMPVHRAADEGGVGAGAALRSSAPAAADVSAVGPVDLAEGESAAGGKGGDRSPAQVFAEALYENLRQT